MIFYAQYIGKQQMAALERGGAGRRITINKCADDKSQKCQATFFEKIVSSSWFLDTNNEAFY
jgi:hypothetical protein